MHTSRHTAEMPTIQGERSALLKIKSELTAIRMEQSFARLEDLEQRYNASQPRAPNGQWIDTGARVAGVILRRIPAVAVALAGYELYKVLSKANSNSQQAVAVFDSRDYRPTAPGSLTLAQVGTLSRAETALACPGLAAVETLSQQATRESLANRPDLRQPLRGTDIHTRLKVSIEADAASRFGAEKSFLKSRMEDVAYGTRGSVRIDVLEDVRNGTICVYDLKTGKAGLDARRSLEIAENVFVRYGPVQRIVVTEMRSGA